MEKELLVKSPVVIRVYIIDCFNLPSKDFNSESDPFISVKLGNQSFDNENEYQENQPNPKFYKMFQITTELPGASDLVISVYDFDDFKSNGKIIIAFYFALKNSWGKPSSTSRSATSKSDGGS